MFSIVRCVLPTRLTTSQAPEQPARTVGIVVNGIDPSLINTCLVALGGWIGKFLDDDRLATIGCNLAVAVYQINDIASRDVVVGRVGMPSGEINCRNSHFELRIATGMAIRKAFIAGRDHMVG